jgi:hypothetical protein
MPIELIWLLPDAILLSRWSGDITEHDACVLVDELGIILDLSEAGYIHDDAIYYYFGSRIPRHPLRGRVALIGASFHSQALADILNRVSQHEMFRLFDSREEAREFLLTHDTPPPDLPPSESTDRTS